MANEKHEVHLVEAERQKLLAIITKGRNKAVVIQRAHILLKVDEGKADPEIGQMLYVSEQTIRRTRLRFAQEGLQAALEDKYREELMKVRLATAQAEPKSKR